MNYISNTADEQEKMLKTIGVEEIEDLFQVIPAEIKLKEPLNIEGDLSEFELKRKIKRKAQQNKTIENNINFLGAGAYDHYIPSIIDHLILRAEYYTAYTPYQAELSQGTLQAIYEFQSMICELTGMDTANASLLDGGSALGEALLMASRITRKNKVVVSKAVHPAYREAAKTYGAPRDIILEEISLKETETHLEGLEEKIDNKTAAVVIQYPNFFGSIEEMGTIQKIISSRKRLLLIVVANPIALGILNPPSEFSADIVVGEGQSLGNSLNYGGPYLGYMACRKKYLRMMPGRIAGATVDAEGKKGYVLTLQTREQHIRREKATSNICTNEALNALIATIYMAVMGKQGLRETAEQSLKKAHYLADRLNSVEQCKVVNKNFFHEFLLETPIAVKKVKNAMLEQNILAGVDIGKFDYDRSGLLVCVTEMRTKEEIDQFVSALEVIIND